MKVRSIKGVDGKWESLALGKGQGIAEHAWFLLEEYQFCLSDLHNLLQPLKGKRSEDNSM